MNTQTESSGDAERMREGIACQNDLRDRVVTLRGSTAGRAAYTTAISGPTARRWISPLRRLGELL